MYCRSKGAFFEFYRSKPAWGDVLVGYFRVLVRERFALQFFEFYRSVPACGDVLVEYFRVRVCLRFKGLFFEFYFRAR